MSIEVMKRALEALELALRSHGVMLLSDPPQEAWKAYSVEAKARDAITALRTAIEQAEKQEQTTVEDNSQNWAGMDGATAWHLIHRHADGWGDVGKMMNEWREANTTPPAAPVQDSNHEFKNFHRVLCERFGYTHDEVDWKRDQISLIEWIAKQVQPAKEKAPQSANCEASGRISSDHARSADYKAAEKQEPWNEGDTAYRPGGMPQEFIAHEAEYFDDWSEWVCPNPEQYFMKCCDCGLVHEMQFNVVKYSEGDECEFVKDADLQAIFRARRIAPPAAPYRAVKTVHEGKPVYVSEPAAQRQWVGLTDEEVQKAFESNAVVVDNGNAYMVAGLRVVNIGHAIEAKLREKNGGGA